VARNLHRALKLDKLAQQQIQGAEFTLVRCQDSKEDIAHGLHARVTENVVGLLLVHLGFQKGPCQFTLDERCFSREMSPDVGMEPFIEAFTNALAAFREATQKLGGFLEPGRRHRPAGFDGHRAPEEKFIKGKDEGAFRFALTWIVSPQGTGWVRHFRVRDTLPYDADHLITSVLSLESFDSCPHFDFESCFWTFTPQEFDPIAAQMIHDTFDKLPWNFPAGLAALAAAEEAMGPAGMQFPPALVPTLKRLFKVAEKFSAIPRPKDSPVAKELESFDVAVSFGQPERHLAEKLARLVGDAGFKVFYDKDHVAALWGRDPTVVLDEIYREKARFCVPFVSKEYVSRKWPAHELRCARARAMDEKGAYILPIQVEDGVELPGLPINTIIYLSLKEYGLERIAEILIQKLQKP
jgi:TIR domain